MHAIGTVQYRFVIAPQVSSARPIGAPPRGQRQDRLHSERVRRGGLTQEPRPLIPHRRVEGAGNEDDPRCYAHCDRQPPDSRRMAKQKIPTPGVTLVSKGQCPGRGPAQAGSDGERQQELRLPFSMVAATALGYSWIDGQGNRTITPAQNGPAKRPGPPSG